MGMIQLFRGATYVALAVAVGALEASISSLASIQGLSPSEAADAIRMLDANQDGRVTFDEVAAFAKAKGLDYAATLMEFSGFDLDRDGQLDSTELARAMGIAAPAARTAVPVIQSLAAQPQSAVARPVGNFQPSMGRQQTMLRSRLNTVQASSGADALSASSQEDVEKRVASLSKYANGLAVEAEKEAQAQEFDRQAALIRANSTAIVQQAQQAARQLGSQAARAKADELFKSLVELQNQAMRAEVRAAALKAKSDAELQEVNDLMFVSQSGLGYAAA